MRQLLPGSLADVRTVSTVAVAIGGGLALLELTSFLDAKEMLLPIAALGAPIVACACIARGLARRRFGRVVAQTSLALAVHALLVFIIVCAVANTGPAKELVLFVLGGVASMFLITFIITTPILLASGLLGPRKDLEAGDAMLGISGVWLAIVQTGTLVFMGDSRVNEGRFAALLCLFGLVLGVGAFGAYVTRAIVRRMWCSRVARGELQGWRVRHVTSDDELATLPPMFGSALRVSAVVERVEVGGMMYRSGLIGEPVAAIRAAAPAAAQALNDA